MKIYVIEKGDPSVTNRILRELPDWFGIESSTLSYESIQKTILWF